MRSGQHPAERLRQRLASSEREGDAWQQSRPQGAPPDSSHSSWSPIRTPPRRSTSGIRAACSATASRAWAGVRTPRTPSRRPSSTRSAAFAAASCPQRRSRGCSGSRATSASSAGSPSGRRSRVESPCDPVELERGHAAPQGRRDELIGLEDALAQLPEQQRRAVLLRDWRGLSYDEVAAQLGVSRAAVETLIFRGRRTLAELLREEPRTTRRRLRSLGDLGSLFSAVKAAFTGGAVATKIAATAVTVAALSGAGAMIGTSGQGAGAGPVDAPATKLAPAGLVASVAPAPTREAQSQTRSLPAAQTTPATRSAVPAVASPSTAAQPTTAATTPVAGTPAGAGPAGEGTASAPPPSAPHAHPAPAAAVPRSRSCCRP